MIDPASVTLIAVTFAASKVLHKMADDAVESLWAKAKKRLRAYLKQEPTPEALTPEVVASAFADEPGSLTDLTDFYGRSVALHRATIQRDLLDGARILWIDDHPANNSWERRALEGFGAVFVTVETTASAIGVAGREKFDAVISDISRDVGDSGLAGLPAISAATQGVPVVLYVGALNPGTPPGALGITNDPEELIHLLLDALGRTRCGRAV